MKSSIKGFVDRIENGRLKGWAFDSSKPDEAVLLQLLHDNTEVVNFLADQKREDLKGLNLGEGRCAFDLVIPKKILDLNEDLLTVKVASTGQVLPKLIPLIDMRKRLSAIFIKGQGLEIGALHNPLWVSKTTLVNYVDRMDSDQLRIHYPDQENITLPNILDDCESLKTIPDSSQDFLIANHVLEHMENPIATIKRHLEVLKAGGILYYIVPDKRFFKDKDRESTSFEHVLDDFTKGPNQSRASHYMEWAKFWSSGIGKISIAAEAQRLDKENYSIHFHVWNYSSFFSFLLGLQDFLNHSFSILIYSFNFTEIICVLRKNPC